MASKKNVKIINCDPNGCKCKVCKKKSCWQCDDLSCKTFSARSCRPESIDDYQVRVYNELRVV